MSTEQYDVIVVGAGNAAMCAAMSAQENGAKVIILERAPEDEAGGNSRYTAGALRFAHNGLQDIMTLVELTEDEKKNNDFGTYTTDQFFDDMFRVTQYRTDPELCEILVTKSLETTHWMHSKGIRFMPMYGRQAFKVDGKMKFWGGLALEFWGGGPGHLGDGVRRSSATSASPSSSSTASCRCSMTSRRSMASRSSTRARCPRSTASRSSSPAAASSPTPTGAPAISARAGTW